MEKRDLVIFSLIVISVLFIAGCQETVGYGGSTLGGRSADSGCGVSTSQPVVVSEGRGKVGCYIAVGCQGNKPVLLKNSDSDQLCQGVRSVYYPENVVIETNLGNKN